MSSKLVEPQLGAESFSCPHCNAFAHQSWFKLYLKGLKSGDDVLVVAHDMFKKERLKTITDVTERKRFEDFLERLEKNVVTFRNVPSEYLNAEMENVHVSRCYSCDGFAVWIRDRLAYPVRESTVAAHEEMPSEVREDFEEAAAIVNRSPRGAAALARLCIQKLMPILGEKGKNLNEDIASLVRKGLESEIQQAMDIVRVTGNNAVHPGQIDLKDDKATAIKLFELLNIVVERRIATPKRIASLFGALPEGDLKAIEKRDKPKE